MCSNLNVPVMSLLVCIPWTGVCGSNVEQFISLVLYIRVLLVDDENVAIMCRWMN